MKVVSVKMKLSVVEKRWMLSIALSIIPPLVVPMPEIVIITECRQMKMFAISSAV